MRRRPLTCGLGERRAHALVGRRASLLHWALNQKAAPRLRVCAVSYLNTVPLVWGMLHGRQRGLFDLDFQIPAECADRLASGRADLGLVPSFELTRQNLTVAPGAGIACHGPVRSILLISSRPAADIRTVAADSSSRTSVQLARIILERRYGATPAIAPHAPDLRPMLDAADAALLIGDSALRVDVDSERSRIYDLGAEWVEMTGLPMVFAVWAGRKEVVTPEVEAAFRESCRYGRERIDEIAGREAALRHFPPGLVRDYLTRRVVHELGPRDYEGLELFLSYARGTATSEERRENSQTAV
jgi:chorismate dehydratase